MNTTREFNTTVKEEVTDETNVLEMYYEIKEEIKDETVEYYENVSRMEENIDTAIISGSLGLAGKYKRRRELPII